MLDRALLYDFQLAGSKKRLWKRRGESYEHVLMKALGFAMYAPEYPELAIEQDVNLRYRPDLSARSEDGRFVFWGECGATSARKINWLLKHAGVERLVLFKIDRGVAQLAVELRTQIAPRYRAPGRLRIINFAADVVTQTASRQIDSVPPHWYTQVDV